MGESSLWWLTTSHCWLFCAQKLSYLHLQRWAIALSEYDYEIDYRCSEKHSICDALSRLFREESKLDSESESYSIRAIEKDFPLRQRILGKPHCWTLCSAKYLMGSWWVGFTSINTENEMRLIFAQRGLPEEVGSENVPQFIFNAFSEFMHKNGTFHTLTSPYYPQSNGAAERAARIGTL